MHLPNPTETRPWGAFLNLFEAAGFKVKLLEVLPGCRLSLQRHRKRSEHWLVVEGAGLLELGSTLRTLGPGDYVSVPLGQVHRVAAIGAGQPLLILELQRGECREDDIERLEDDYGRTEPTK